LYFSLGLATKVGHDKGSKLKECSGIQVCIQLCNNARKISPNTLKGIPILGVGILKIFGNFETRFENQACSNSRPFKNH